MKIVLTDLRSDGVRLNIALEELDRRANKLPYVVRIFDGLIVVRKFRFNSIVVRQVSGRIQHVNGIGLSSAIGRFWNGQTGHTNGHHQTHR